MRTLSTFSLNTRREAALFIAEAGISRAFALARAEQAPREVMEAIAAFTRDYRATGRHLWAAL